MPTSPRGAALPVWSTTRTSTPANGKPTVPSTRAPSRGFDVMMIVSDMPYRSRIRYPVRCSQARKVCSVSGAEPEMNSRMPAQR